MNYDLLGWLEKNLREGNFSIIDKYLNDTSVNDLESVDILIILTITFWGKDNLPNRNIFLQRSEHVLKARLGVERGESLLKYRR